MPKPIKLDVEKGRRYLEEAYQLGVKEICFGLMDEPFVSNDLESFVLFSKNIGFNYIFMNTNGALARKERVKMLFANGLNSIKFSINAALEETYKKVHGKDDFIKVIDNLMSASSLRSEMNIDVAIFVSYVENSCNYGEDKFLLEKTKDFVDQVYVVKAVNQGGGMFEEVQEKLVSGTESLWGRFKVKENEKHISSKVCPFPFKRISITPEGFFTPCCVDAKNELVVADLNKVSLQEAWNNKLITEFRHWHLTGNIPQNCKCYNCYNNTNNAVSPLNILVADNNI